MSEFDWEYEIEQAIRFNGGRMVPNRHIYQYVNRRLREQNLNRHLRPTEYGGRPMSEHTIRGYLSRLVEEGQIIRERRGFYSIV